MAAVVTTPEIAEAFDTGMEYFNTFGGNPVSCAIGLAVLDVIEEENLVANAGSLGRRFMGQCDELAERHELIGDVRGQGLYIGVELVANRESRDPRAGGGRSRHRSHERTRFPALDRWPRPQRTEGQTTHGAQRRRYRRNDHGPRRSANARRRRPVDLNHEDSIRKVQPGEF